jgi:hypothetical protein
MYLKDRTKGSFNKNKTRLAIEYTSCLFELAGYLLCAKSKLRAKAPAIVNLEQGPASQKAGSPKKKNHKF